jgi:DNA-binding SARP family transcriptional activator
MMTASPAKNAESTSVRTEDVHPSTADSLSSVVPAAQHHSQAPHVPLAPIGYGLLGAGIVALLDRMRRAQQRLRPTGLRIALPEGDLVELERGLRISSDPGSADWIDLSLRLLSVTVRRNQLEPPVVSAVRLRENAVEIMFDPKTPVSLPTLPFETGPDGKSWLLKKDGDRLEALRSDPEIVGIDAPLPSLVTFGRNELGLLLVNIETAGSVAISGTDADALVQTVAIELATAKWADQIDLVLVGFGEDKRGLERVGHATSLRSVVTKMERRVRERDALLKLIDSSSNGETRWLEGGDAWDLAVVVCSSEAASEELVELGELVAVVGDGSLGVAVVCGCDIKAARWRVRADGGRVSAEGVGRGWSPLSRQPVPPDFADGVAALVSVAARTGGVTPDQAPYDKLSLRAPDAETGPGLPVLEATVGRDDIVSENISPDEPTVEVRVLGLVAISGASRQFTRAWAVELVVYLAMHRGGASNEQWATALWPERAMAPASLHSTASAARRSLGNSASGEDHLPRSRGRLVLGPYVRTDWDRLVELSRSTLPDDWREALHLVRGRPFDGLRSPDWIVLEGILANIEAVVVDLACRYSEHCLEAQDASGAEWAARQALRVSAYDERLYRVLMRAADAAGNPAGVESVMSELVHLVAEDVEPFDAVHPETLALYRKLSRRSFVSRTP